MKAKPRRRRLGQHFLANETTARRIVEAAGIGADDTVLEIGPGQGALTGFLVRTGARVVALELDEALGERIASTYAGPRFRMVPGDALTADFAEVVGEEPEGRVVLVGNLPYRITGSLMERILDAHALWRTAVLMVQREVGHRISAEPGGKEYGVLSVAAAIRARRKRLFDVPPGAFNPPPKVHSSVVRLDFDPSYVEAVDDERMFFRVVRAAFQQRRKKIRNALASLAGSERADALLAAAGIAPDLRPESITPAQFNRIAVEMKTLARGTDVEQA